ncbi:MAG: substrate-binding domain-containing protein [Kiritimatiellae bacterium]|nr:substrate-binding domain-containing protein [Kiritimatiellia bacterium]
MADDRLGHGGPHVPFMIDGASGKCLVELTAAGVRAAILDGRYAAGEVLPTQEAMSKALGVSVRVTREALAQLAEEGFVKSRGRRGTVVLHRREMRWKGRIVYLHSPYIGSYHFSRFEESLARVISEADWLFASVTVPLPDDAMTRTPPCAARAQIDAFVAAHCREADLVLVHGCIGYAAHAIDGCGVPWIALMERDGLDGGFANCRGVAPSMVVSAVREFVLHCCQAGVKRVVAMNLRPQTELEEGLARVGVAYESWIVAPYDLNVLESYPQSAFDSMLARYGKSSRDLPDLLVFTDDYLARGALVALLALGIRVPQDVNVATLVNKDFAPVFPVPLTRYEVDPASGGEAAAQCVLSYLEDGRLPDDVILNYTYIKGSSFP